MNNIEYPFSSETSEFMGMRKAAKVLNRKIGGNRLLKFLRDKKYLDNQNQPYPEFENNGFFLEVSKVTYGMKGRIRMHHLVPLVSQSCLISIWDEIRIFFTIDGRYIGNDPSIYSGVPTIGSDPFGKIHIGKETGLIVINNQNQTPYEN
jgi:hypothetical protein